MLDTGVGGDCGGVFGAALNAEGIVHVQRDTRHKDALAMVESVIVRLKQAMGKDMSETGSERWVDALPRAVSALNSRPHPHVFDAAPEDLQSETEQDNKELARQVDVQAGVDILANAKQSQQATDKLREAGAYRVLLPKREWPRVDQPRWSAEVHRVQNVRGGYVTDTAGERTQLRFALPVPANSADVEAPRALRGGNAARNTARRQALEPFVTALVAHLQVLGRSASLQEAGSFLATLPGYTDMVRRLNLHAGGIRAVAALFDDLMLAGDGAETRVEVRRRG